MAKRENNFDLTESIRDWTTEAAGYEFNTTWGGTDVWKNEVTNLQFYRAQTAWLESEPNDLHVRRRAVLALARGYFTSNEAIAEVEKRWNAIPVDSLSIRLADTICTLYDESPARTFSETPEVNESFTDLYNRFDADLAMQEAYRAALFTNTVVLMPDWDSETIQVLTPDYFRIVTDGKGNMQKLWLVHGSNGRHETKFEEWTPEFHSWYDHEGKFVKKDANPYKRIPATLMRLNRTNSIYGAGITEAAELNVWNNFIRFLSTNIAVFQSFSVALASNMGDALKNGARIGPGQIFVADNPSGEQGSVPSFGYVTPDGKFIDLEAFSKSVVARFEKNQGLPGYLIDDSSGQPPSGIALMVAERALNKKRRQHTYALTRAEKDLAQLMETLGKTHGASQIEWPSARTISNFGIQFAKPESFEDPKASLEFDKQLKEEGLLAPSTYTKKYTGLTHTDEEAVDFMRKNRNLYSAPAPTVPNIT